MSRYLLLADIHASDRAPSSCTDRYCTDILDLLRQTVQVAGERQVRAVVWAGDVFHSKAPARVSHKLVQQLIEVVRSYPCPVYIVPGNHDLRNDRLESVRETQPLGVLLRAGARLLDGWAGRDYQHQYNLFGVPWQQDWSADRVREVLAPYREQVFVAGTELVASAPLVVTHAPLYPPGKELPYEFYPAGQWVQDMGGSGYCFYGHVHEPHGVWDFGDVTFCNNGALSRGSLHEYNLTRQVGCTLWDDETGEFEFIPLDAPPASEVFRLQEKQQLTDMNGRLDAFLEDIGHARLETLTTESVIAYVKTLGLGKQAESLVEELLAEAVHRQGS